MTTDPNFSIALESGETVDFVCQDTADAAYDGPANAPEGAPARRSLFWLRAFASDLDHYLIQHATGQSTPAANDWVDVGTVKHDGAWSYRWLSAVLADVTWHWFRVVPVDAAGNEGDPVTFGPEFVVRRPDAPGFAATFVPATTKVTFAAA
jgi:hypothetical protein